MASDPMAVKEPGDEDVGASGSADHRAAPRSGAPSVTRLRGSGPSLPLTRPAATAPSYRTPLHPALPGSQRPYHPKTPPTTFTGIFDSFLGPLDGDRGRIGGRAGPARSQDPLSIIVDGYQAKDHSLKRANGRDVTFTDGSKIFLGSSGTGAPYEKELLEARRGKGRC